MLNHRIELFSENLKCFKKEISALTYFDGCTSVFSVGCPLAGNKHTELRCYSGESGLQSGSCYYLPNNPGNLKWVTTSRSGTKCPIWLWTNYRSRIQMCRLLADKSIFATITYNHTDWTGFYLVYSTVNHVSNHVTIKHSEDGGCATVYLLSIGSPRSNSSEWDMKKEAWLHHPILRHVLW